MTQTINLDDLMSSKEAAKLLGIKSNTLEVWRHQGRGPQFVKLGDSRQSMVRYLRSAVITWVAQRSFSSTSGYGEAVLKTTANSKIRPAKSRFFPDPHTRQQ